MADEKTEHTAAGMIARETLGVVPADAKKVTGENVGAILAHLTGSAAEIALFLRIITGAPRFLVTRGARLINRWRALPPEERAQPSPNLLLDAATSYESSEEGVRGWWDNLLNASIEKASAQRMHPAFSGMLKQMTAIDVRLLSLFPNAPARIYEGYWELINMNDLRVQDEQLRLSIGNLKRLELIATRVVTTAPAANLKETKYPDHLPSRFSLVTMIALESYMAASFSATHFVQVHNVMEITPYGVAFYEACSGKKFPAHSWTDEEHRTATRGR